MKNKEVLIFNELNNIYFNKFNINDSEKNNYKKKNFVHVLSPGRVNIIGEHTDYNYGLALTMAINKYKYMIGVKNDTNFVNIYDNGLKQFYSFNIGKILYDDKVNWPNYIKGIVNEYIKNNYIISGFDLVIDSNLLSEAGVSSSAAILAGTAKILEEIFNLEVSLRNTMEYCKNAENMFVGINNGSLDHFSVLFGKEKNAIFLNFKDLSYDYIPLNLKNFLFLIIDSKEARNLINTDYNKRRQECNDALRILKEDINIISLSDISLDLLSSLEKKIDANLFKRVRHIVTENLRVIKAIEYLKNGDNVSLGKLLFESHVSLRDDYKVSTEKLDYIFDTANNLDGVYGLRLMGAGFGGSLISLVSRNKVKQIIEELSNLYFQKYKIIPGFIKCKTSDGTKIVES
jgi:galactokinase